MAAVFVVHGTHSWPLAARLAMDLISEGIEAVPMPLDEFRAPDRGARLAAAAGLIIMYDWWVEPADFEVLHEVRKTRPVVFARNRTTKVAPELMPFSVVAIFDSTTFSHYQPVEGWGGYIELTEHFGRPTPPDDERRRGFAFVSYASVDRQIVYEQVIPALASCRTGYFDYRFTERLDEAQLDHELTRTIEASRIVVAYASREWRTDTRYISAERELARRFGRPIVAVTTPADTGVTDPSMVRCVFGPDRTENAQTLERAIRDALQGIRSPA